MPDNSEKLIEYVSRTLSTAEKNYSEMEKEALACIYIWWPGLDQDIEWLVEDFHVCPVNSNTPPSTPLQLWQ